MYLKKEISLLILKATQQIKRLPSDIEHTKHPFQISKALIYQMVTNVAEQMVYAVLFTHLTRCLPRGYLCSKPVTQKFGHWTLQGRFTGYISFLLPPNSDLRHFNRYPSFRITVSEALLRIKHSIEYTNGSIIIVVLRKRLPSLTV